MSEFFTRARTALAAIRAAFSSLSYPGTAQVLETQNNDDGLDLVKELGAKHWSELGIRELFEHRAGLWSLSPAGYQFYLPAFMSAALAGDSTQEAGDVRDSVLASLAFSSQNDGERRFLRRISLLTQDQKRAVRSFLHAIQVAGGSWSRDPAADPSGFWFT